MTDIERKTDELSKAIAVLDNQLSHARQYQRATYRRGVGALIGSVGIDFLFFVAILGGFVPTITVLLPIFLTISLLAGIGWFFYRRAQKAERAHIEYRQHLAQLPTHIAQLEQEAGLDVARWTYDYDEYDRLISNGELAYCYSHLPHETQLQPSSDAPEYPCKQCGKSWHEDYFPLSRHRERGICINCDEYNHAYDKLNHVGERCAVCNVAFDGDVHCAVARGATLPLICASCEIQRQKAITTENSVEWDEIRLNSPNFWTRQAPRQEAQMKAQNEWIKGGRVGPNPYDAVGAAFNG